MTFKEREWAYAKWCEGYTQQQIADALHVSVRTVQRVIGNRQRVRPVLAYVGKADKRGGVGIWQDMSESYNDVPHYRCSECGKVFFSLVSGWHYCPNCGAKMEGMNDG